MEEVDPHDPPSPRNLKTKWTTDSFYIPISDRVLSFSICLPAKIILCWSTGIPSDYCTIYFSYYPVISRLVENVIDLPVNVLTLTSPNLGLEVNIF
jgi:hypothetical protein